MAQDSDPLIVDSNWLFCYVVVALIPVIFVCVATYSVWRDRRTRTKYDMESINKTYAGYWGGLQDPTEMRPPSTRPPRPGFNVPTLMVNRVGPRTPSGFPVPAPSMLELAQQRSQQRQQMKGVVSPEAVPGWTRRHPPPSNMYTQQAGGQAPWDGRYQHVPI